MLQASNDCDAPFARCHYCRPWPHSGPRETREKRGRRKEKRREEKRRERERERERERGREEKLKAGSTGVENSAAKPKHPAPDSTPHTRRHWSQAESKCVARRASNRDSDDHTWNHSPRYLPGARRCLGACDLAGHGQRTPPPYVYRHAAIVSEDLTSCLLVLDFLVFLLLLFCVRGVHGCVSRPPPPPPPPLTQW